jgi:hypothetical protein
VDSANQTVKATVELWLFDTTFTPDNDNAAFTPTDAELLTLVGIIQFSTWFVGDATAAAGETEGAGTDDAQNQHFIAFVNFNGMVYELDGCNTHVPGRRSNPRCCSSDPLLSF